MVFPIFSQYFADPTFAEKGPFSQSGICVVFLKPGKGVISHVNFAVSSHVKKACETCQAGKVGNVHNIKKFFALKTPSTRPDEHFQL